MPLVAPDDFTIVLGAVMAGGTMRGLEVGMEALGGPERGLAALMNVLGWVEDVFIRCREIQRDAGRLRGAVMAVGAAMAGELGPARPRHGGDASSFRYPRLYWVFLTHYLA